MQISDEKTWPRDVLDHLDEFGWVFKSWECRGKARERVSGGQYDEFVFGLRAVLQRHAILGYHCTRLTEQEISAIMREGMQPLSGSKLRERVAALRHHGLITSDFAEQLSSRNEANAPNRRGMIWFIFYPPHRAHEDGVAHFFGHWGGESLYMSHERAGVIEPRLGQIGIPCIVEAEVPFACLNEHGFVDTVIARQYLKRRGLRTRAPVDAENYAKHPVPATAIRRIIRYPSRDFIRLTRCDRWATPLLGAQRLPSSV